MRKLCATGNTEPVPKRISGDGSAPPRFLVAVNFALQSACFRNPPVLLRYGSSSRKIFALQIFFGSPVLLGFPVISRLFFRSVCLTAAARSAAALVYAKHTPQCQNCYALFYISLLYNKSAPYEATALKQFSVQLLSNLVLALLFLTPNKEYYQNPTMPSMLAVVVVSIVPTHLRKDEAIFGKLFRNGFFFAEHTATISMIQLSVIWSWASIRTADIGSGFDCHDKSQYPDKPQSADILRSDISSVWTI